MARSHIGRLLEERIQQEINKFAVEAVTAVKDFETLRYIQGRVAGMREVTQMLDELEKD